MYSEVFFFKVKSIFMARFSVKPKNTNNALLTNNSEAAGLKHVSTSVYCLSAFVLHTSYFSTVNVRL